MMPLADEQLIRLASDDPRIYDDARRWFLSQGPSVAPALVKGLYDKGLGDVGHWRILLLLREFALPSTLPAVLKAFRAALADKNWIVLPGAMEALAVFDSEDALSALISALDSTDPDTVNHAAALLGNKRSKRAEDALATLLNHEDAAFRQSGARGLLKINTESALNILRQHLGKEKDPGVLKLLKELK
jgi:hypothetical protein